MRPQSASLFDFDFYEPLPIRVGAADASWPHPPFFERVARHVSRRPAVAHFWTG